MVSFSHDSYDKCDDFDFVIVNFPYLSSNISESPAYGVFVSQLIRYARVGSKYEDFLFRGSSLVSKLLKQGYSSRTTFRKFYGRHTDLVHKFDTSAVADPGFGGRWGVNCHKQGRSPCPRHEVPSGGRVREGGVPPPYLERKLKSGNSLRIFEAHQNSYFVRLYCMNILTKHIFNYKLVKKIGLHFLYFLRDERCGKKMVERKCKLENA